MRELLLTKSLAALLSPLALFFLLALCGLLLAWRQRRRFGAVIIVLGALWLLLWSLRPASDWLAGTLELRYPARAAGDYPTVDAIVVLGGGVEGSRPGWHEQPQLSAAGDRLFAAAELYRAGRAPRVILSGGNTPWSRAEQPEAEAMAELLGQLGVPRTAMLLDTQSLDTHENALEVKKLVDTNAIGRVLLVTSALHMPRAMATFERSGIDALAAPADVEAVPPRTATALDFVPDARALDLSTRAWHEYAGLAAYRLRGWAQ